MIAHHHPRAGGTRPVLVGGPREAEAHGVFDDEHRP